MNNNKILSYENYYQECYRKASEYQDFVTNQLLKHGIIITNYTSKKYQYEKGENGQGIEIKYDQKLEETGNLYIEIAEKSNPNKPNYSPSGLYRSDNTWLFLIGNYEKLFFFGKKTLKRELSRANEYKKIITATSKGFLMPEYRAKMFAERILEFK